MQTEITDQWHIANRDVTNVYKYNKLIYIHIPL